MYIISELLLSFLDLAVIGVDAFDPYKIYGKDITEYQAWRKGHHVSSSDAARLFKEGYLQKSPNKIVLTQKGYNNISKMIAQSLEISKTKSWDGVWRVVVFDIPEERRSARNLFRKRLKNLGLEMVQKSVFCHPHDCIKEVIFLAKVCGVERYVTFMEVSSIVTGKDIFKIFREKDFI